MKKIFTNSFCKSNLFALHVFLFILSGALSLHAQEHHKINIDVDMDEMPRPPRPKFMDYNLGANPTITDPIDQMKYLANQTDQLDATVFGGWFQWGRKTWDYAVDTVSYLRYSGDGAANHAVAWAPYPTMDYDGNGQLIGQDAYHVYSTIANNYDWSVPQNHALWGNGDALYTATPGAGAALYTDGYYYQKPVKTVNDPCPTGFRVPTQNDWELISNYDCNPSTAAGSFSASSLITKPANNTGLTWVSVSCGGGDCIVADDWGSAGSFPWGGYAVYKTTVWESSGLTSGNSLIAFGAPQPILFLPAAGIRGRTSGAMDYIGTRGYYWSSCINGTNTYNLYFNSANVTLYSSNARTYGFSIRCVKCGAEPCD